MQHTLEEVDGSKIMFLLVNCIVSLLVGEYVNDELVENEEESENQCCDRTTNESVRDLSFLSVCENR